MHCSARFFLSLLVALATTALLASAALAAPPANDNFAAAEPHSAGGRFATNFMFTDATREPGEPTVLGSDTDHTGWIAWTAPANGFMRASTCANLGSGQDSADVSLGIYSGTAVSSLATLTQATSNCQNGFSNAITDPVAVSAGQTYHVQVGTSTTIDRNQITVSIDFNTSVPANDNFAQAQEITGLLPQTLDFDNGLATSETNELDNHATYRTNGVWFKWTATADARMTVDTCSSPNPGVADSYIDVYSGTGSPVIDAVTHEASSDDDCGADTFSFASFDATDGVTYWIRVANYTNQYGSEYKLRVRQSEALTNLAPPGFWENPAVYAMNNVYVQRGAWDSVSSIYFDYVWQRCDAAGANCVPIAGAPNQDHYTPTVADYGHRLLVTVSADDGNKQLSLDTTPSGIVLPTPVNDLFADATDLGAALPTSVDGYNYFSDRENNEPTTPSSTMRGTVWYRWTAPSSEQVVIDTCATPANGLPRGDTDLGIYTGAGPVETLQLVASDSSGCSDAEGGARLTLDATAGTVYSIQVGEPGWDIESGFRLSISRPPAAPAIDPFPQPKLAKSLGTVKVATSGKFSLKKLKLSCGASATGSCTGTIKLKTKATKVKDKKAKGKKVKSVAQTFKFSIKPGATSSPKLKAGSKLKKALKRARKLKASVTLKIGAPGFPQKSASSSVTLKR